MSGLHLLYNEACLQWWNLVLATKNVVVASHDDETIKDLFSDYCLVRVSSLKCIVWRGQWTLKHQPLVTVIYWAWLVIWQTGRIQATRGLSSHHPDLNMEQSKKHMAAICSTYTALFLIKHMDTHPLWVKTWQGANKRNKPFCAFVLLLIMIYTSKTQGN